MDPPSAMTSTIAFSSDARVMMSRGRMFFFSSSSTTRPASRHSCSFSGSSAGIDELRNRNGKQVSGKCSLSGYFAGMEALRNRDKRKRSEGRGVDSTGLPPGSTSCGTEENGRGMSGEVEIQRVFRRKGGERKKGEYEVVASAGLPPEWTSCETEEPREE